VLGLPDDVVPIGLAFIGKPDDDPAPSSRFKERQQPLQDLIHWQRW
jgi:nitroreductase